MKAYKGFNKDMTCRDFQFEEGKEYEHKGKVNVCESGFHACERPLDCFDYYNPALSVYHEVKVDGDISKADGDTKVAAKKIKIGARLDIAGLVRAQFEYVKEHATTEHADLKTASAGDYGAANAGDYGAANAGDYGAASAGDCGAAVSRGSASVGSGGVAIARGDERNQNKVKGGIGAILVIALEPSDSTDIIEWKAAIVDGKKIKADTWYCLKNGELVEVEDVKNQ